MASFSKVLCTMVAYNTIFMTTSVRLQLQWLYLFKEAQQQWCLLAKCFAQWSHTILLL